MARAVSPSLSIIGSTPKREQTHSNPRDTTVQRVIYNTTAINTTTRTTASLKTAKPGAELVRWIARKWDLVGVLTLLGSSTAYGVFALAHRPVDSGS